MRTDRGASVKKMGKRILLLFAGVIIMMNLFGCGKTKYKVDLGTHDFKSKKTLYAAGETVTVYYDVIATDTDYYFYTDSEDVTLEQSYDQEHGCVLTFIMPEHDVKMIVESRNSMEYVPEAPEPEEEPEPRENPETEIWFCRECGARNDRLYCRDCGVKKPGA